MFTVHHGGLPTNLYSVQVVNTVGGKHSELVDMCETYAIMTHTGKGLMYLKGDNEALRILDCSVMIVYGTAKCITGNNPS